jgi:hypothetical protein
VMPATVWPACSRSSPRARPRYTATGIPGREMVSTQGLSNEGEPLPLNRLWLPWASVEGKRVEDW